MRQQLKIFGCVGVFLLTFCAYAQDRDRDRGDDRFYRGRLFEHVRGDLDRIQEGSFPLTGDWRRVVRAKQELNELQEKMDAGRRDPAELNDVIQALQAVVNNNHIDARERDRFSDDLARLREFGERTEGWGFQGNRDRDADRGRDRDGDRDRFYSGRLFEHVRGDLDRVEDMTFPLTADRHRVARAKEELNELQGKLAGGRYDPTELSEVIETMQFVVSNNHLSREQREALSDDLARLREFRERHSEWR
ncbi:MAG TPA: hypothetical protein VKU01_26015 [Bryobacteraceae bacterium]|nr:hypothetical protein [Bryobacteraceae bacterium]